MQALTLPARHGWRWLADGFAIFRKKQLMLSLIVLSYWMLMALLNSLPLVGQIAATLLIPAFSVSLMTTCRLIDLEQPLPPQLLFSGFKQNVRTLLVLGAVYFALSAGILSLTTLVDDGALFNLVVRGATPSEGPVQSDALTLAGELTILLFLPVAMAFWFAPVLVAWHGLPAGKSLFFSFVACARNWRAFLVYAAAIVVLGALVPSLAISLLSSVFPEGANAFSTMFTAAIILVLAPTLYASFYASYRDVFVTIDDNA